MAAFGLQITNPEGVKEIMQIRQNLLIDDIVKNPFNGKITAHGKDFFTVVLDPVWPKVYLFAWLPLFTAALFWGTLGGTISLWLAAFIFVTRVFWTNSFYFLLFYIKTKGGVKYVPAKEALARVV
jgi:hypothetical protein